MPSVRPGNGEAVALRDGVIQIKPLSRRNAVYFCSVAYTPRLALRRRGAWHGDGASVNHYHVAFSAGTGVGCLAFVRVMSTTLVSTHRVPRIVRIPNASPPRTYPRITATTGFTYA